MKPYNRCNDFIKVGDVITLSGSDKKITILSYQFIGCNEVSMVLRASSGYTLFVVREKRFVSFLDMPQ